MPLSNGLSVACFGARPHRGASTTKHLGLPGFVWRMDAAHPMFVSLKHRREIDRTEDWTKAARFINRNPNDLLAPLAFALAVLCS